MKPDAVLINVARGAVVVEGDLWACMSAKAIGGAIIDVWWCACSANRSSRAVAAEQPVQ